MRFYTLLFFIVSLVFSIQTLSAQSTWKWQLELGMGASQAPYQRSEVRYGRTLNETWKPIYGQLFGVLASFPKGKHLILRTGLQFQVSGQQYAAIYRGNLYYGDYLIYDQWEDVIMHKLCVPITALRQWNLGKNILAVNGGFRAMYVVYGRDTYKRESQISEAAPLVSSTIRFSPFSKADCYDRASPLNLQAILGASFIRKRWELGADMYLGLGIYYSKSKYGTNYDCCVSSSTVVSNSDLVVSVKYGFGKMRARAAAQEPAEKP